LKQHLFQRDVGCRQPPRHAAGSVQRFGLPPAFLNRKTGGNPRFFAWGRRSPLREILENPLRATARVREILENPLCATARVRDSDDDPWENRFSPTDSNRAPRDSSSVPWEMRVSPWEKAPGSKELARVPFPNELIPSRKIRFARFCGLIVWIISGQRRIF
jgi:hypothetical protein